MACVMHECQQMLRRERKGKEGKGREGKGRGGKGRGGKGCSPASMVARDRLLAHGLHLDLVVEGFGVSIDRLPRQKDVLPESKQTVPMK